MRMLPLHGLSVEGAVRFLLLRLRLPGEAPRIDPMFEAMAKSYCEQNPEVDLHPDTAFILMFSIVMLNTDLHNPGVKNRMSGERFVQNQCGIDNGRDLPEQYLLDIY